MAEFIKADISNADAAMATRDSAFALLRRLESVLVDLWQFCDKG